MNIPKKKHFWRKYFQCSNPFLKSLVIRFFNFDLEVLWALPAEKCFSVFRSSFDFSSSLYLRSSAWKILFNQQKQDKEVYNWVFINSYKYTFINMYLYKYKYIF